MPRAAGATNWTRSQAMAMLDIVEVKRPSGPQEWENVANLYNKKAILKDWTEKDGKQIKAKFFSMAHTKKPTGSGKMQTPIKRAHRIEEMIEERAVMETLGHKAEETYEDPSSNVEDEDSNGDESGGSDDSSDDDHSNPPNGGASSSSRLSSPKSTSVSGSPKKSPKASGSVSASSTPSKAANGFVVGDSKDSSPFKKIHQSSSKAIGDVDTPKKKGKAALKKSEKLDKVKKEVTTKKKLKPRSSPVVKAMKRKSLVDNAIIDLTDSVSNLNSSSGVDELKSEIKNLQFQFQSEMRSIQAQFQTQIQGLQQMIMMMAMQRSTPSPPPPSAMPYRYQQADSFQPQNQDPSAEYFPGF